MTSLRAQVPPVNLKERIAALQQKNADQSQRPTSPPPTTAGSSSSVPQSNVAALREKIAKFEKKGGVPVPRGSFGLGAPPSDSGQSKTSRELYGNRIPAPVKPQTTGGSSIRPQYTGGSLMQQFTGPANSRSPSPFEGPPRSFSPPSPPLEPLKPVNTGRRGTEFSKALELARKVAADTQQVYDPRLREDSTSPIPSSPPPIIANRRFSMLMDDPPAIVVSPQLDLTTEIEVASSDPVTFDKAEAPSSDIEESVDPMISHGSRYEESLSLDSISPIKPTSATTLANESLQEALSNDAEEQTKDESVPHNIITVFTEIEKDESSEEVTPQNEDPAEASTAPLVTDTEPITPIEMRGNTSEQTEITLNVTVADSPLIAVLDDLSFDSSSSSSAIETQIFPLDASSTAPPQGPADVGMLHDDVSNHEPYPLSATSTPSARAENELPPSPAHLSAGSNTDVVDSDTMETKFLPPLSIPSPAAAGRDSFLSHSIDDPSPRSSYTDSPGHLTLAHKISPITSRGVPVFLPGIRSPTNVKVEAIEPNVSSSDAERSNVLSETILPKGMERGTTTTSRTLNKPTPINLDAKSTPESEHQRPKTAVPSAWSDTISPPGVEFGTVVVGDPSRRPVPTMAHPRSFSSSYAEADFNPAFEGKKTSHTFTAVVHEKTRDKPAVHSATLPRANYSTPQRRGGRPPTLENPMSPGLGDLISLVEQSAILEQKLMNGEYPDEAAGVRMIQEGALSAPARPSMGSAERQAKEAEDQEKYKELLRRRPSTKSMKGRGSSDSRRKPSFSLRNPLARSKSGNRKEDEADLGLGSAPPPLSREVAVPNRSKSMFLTSSQPSFSNIPPVPNIPPVANINTFTDDIPPTPPPKSPSTKYLSSFRRFASTRSQGASQRHSVSMSSEISSEDSVAVLTPPDNSPGFTGTGPLLQTRSRTQSGNRPGSVINMPWPSMSPKKSQGSVSRATSFAGKMFRGRKKSNASTMSSLDSDPSHNMIPELPNVLPPSPPLHELLAPETSFDSLHPPSTPPHNGGRPSLSTRTSWISTTSNDSSVRSPLLDKDFFDSFPSVPQTIPTPNTRSVMVGHSKEHSHGVAFPRQSSDGNASSNYTTESSLLGRAASTRSTSTLGPHNNQMDLL
ncbi:hypothetical protein F5050DRAFT_761987 [Lentinula boryana]|uniref:Proteophosphoglycan ppg4 n=1 Tax=Lentinula boryana TaxID=40481 RepID=A0ABQ8Q3F6_9AGAR|nr:hypothetical protein F5050DRAFT_761987 [Lentinula boryana]